MTFRGTTIKLQRLFASNAFFYVVLGFFIFQALWFVFSAIYPMAFDEEFHFGIIQIYSHQWSPFLNGQPGGADSFGALASDPSFLYHYLMSFPERLLAGLTDNQTAQVIVLRLINVALFAYSLVLFRKFLLRIKASPALAHIILAVFVLIPIVPMLAAHINYDNLLMVLVAWLCLLVLDITDHLARRDVPIRLLIVLVIVCLLTCLVKYPALPIAAAIMGFVVYQVWRQFRGQGHQFIQATRRSVGGISRASKILLVLLFLVSAVLFGQRYGVNMYRYHTPVPDCDVVLSEARCMAYGPWQRNHLLAAQHPQFNHSPVNFTLTWAHDLWKRLYFAVNGPKSDYATRLPLPVPSVTAAVLGLFGLVMIIVYWRRVFWHNPGLQLAMAIIVTYVLVLWLDNYSQYLYTGVPVAINGRYLLPVAILAGAVVGRAIGIAYAKRPELKLWLATITLTLLLWGGGVMTFMVRSDSSWNWPNSFVVDANNAARSVLRPLIPEGMDR